MKDLYFYEYKEKNGAKVGGHNLEKITSKNGVIKLEGVDFIQNYEGEYESPWVMLVDNKELEYLTIRPMEEVKI